MGIKEANSRQKSSSQNGNKGTNREKKKKRVMNSWIQMRMKVHS
jgi:hypothetical protein